MLKAAVAVLYLSSWVSEAIAADTVPIPKLIEAFDWEWLTAYDRHDRAALERRLGADVVITHPNGRVTSRVTELDDVMMPLLPGASVLTRLSDVAVRVHSDVAISTGAVITEVTFAGKRGTSTARYTNTYQRQGTTWILVAAHFCVACSQGSSAGTP